jgi:hypothetical protein
MSARGMETYTADDAFPFSALVLGSPRPVQGGAHFTQASLGPGRPLYVQFPRCSLKQGIVTTKRACYCDLMYDKAQAETLITWLLSLESAAQEQIFRRRDTWFHTDLSRDDVESMLTPMSRLYRSGRSLLIRAHLRIDKLNGRPRCTAYDEREAAVDLEGLDPEATLIPLVLIDGVKFSSRSFEIEVKLVQLMVLDPRPEPATACLIRHIPVSGSNLRGAIVSPSSPPSVLAPVDAAGVQASVDATQAPIDATQAPIDATQAPIDATQAPVDATQAPVDATQAPVDATQAPVDATQAPVDATQAPVDATQAPIDATQAPIDATQAPIDATQAPVDATQAAGAKVADIEVPTLLPCAASDGDCPPQEESHANAPSGVRSPPAHRGDQPSEEPAEASVAPQAAETSDEALEATEPDASDDIRPSLHNQWGLLEVDVGVESDSECMQLRRPDEVYREIYRAARRKAKQMRRAAVAALLEAQQIKARYMLDDLEDSEEDDGDDRAQVAEEDDGDDRVQVGEEASS